MIVAKRTLKLQGGSTRADIDIHRGVLEQRDGAWECRYEIDRPEGQEVTSSWGID